MAVLGVKTSVEVCVWIPKANGGYTNALMGARGERQGNGRVGHASLKIFPSAADKTTYSSLIIKGKDHIYVSLWPGRFEKTHDDDLALEGEKPNAIIRLRKLNISLMLAELNKVVTANWTLKSKVGSPLDTPQSCAGFVLKLLEIGEIYTKYPKARYGGPRSWTFYCDTRCHYGDILGGLFNSFPWRAWIVSPKLVLHVAASAAESDSDDKKQTLILMKSSDVHQDWSFSAAAGIVAAGAVVAGSAGGAAVIATYFTAAFVKQRLAHH